MASLRIFLVVCMTLLVAGCGGGSDPEDERAAEDAPDGPAAQVDEADVEDGDIDAETLDLEAVDDSGIDGRIRISPGDDDTLRLEVELEGDFEATHGIQARMGSCKDAVAPDAVDDLLGDAAGYTLPDVEDGTMETDAKLPEDLVSEGTYTLLVHAGEDLDEAVVTCADVEVR